MKNIFDSKTKKKTISILLFHCVKYGILSPEEAEHCLKTSKLPDDILQRLKIADLKNRN